MAVVVEGRLQTVQARLAEVEARHAEELVQVQAAVVAASGRLVHQAEAKAVASSSLAFSRGMVEVDQHIARLAAAPIPGPAAGRVLEALPLPPPLPVPFQPVSLCSRSAQPSHPTWPAALTRASH